MTTTYDETMIAMDRSLLERRLATLLGFDDISETFEYLLSIDSSENLREYLSDFLGGSNGDSVTSFVADVGRWKKGEPIEKKNDSESDGKDAMKNTTTVPLDYSEMAKSNKTQKAKTRKQQKKIGGGSGRRERQRRGDNNTAVTEKPRASKLKNESNDQPMTGIASSSSLSSSPPNENNNNTSKITSVNTSPSLKPTEKNEMTDSATFTRFVAKEEKINSSLPPPRPIQRGTAKRVCGCFGTKHKALTNCLDCGRISCELEGYDFCPFCGYAIEAITVTVTANGKKDKSLLHKERLLAFDREFAQRTVVFDDQEDYFSNARSEWLTEEEKFAADEKESQRREDLHERKTMLNVAF